MIVDGVDGPDGRHRLARERQLGFDQGEAFDRRLREQELADREERLSRSVCGLGAGGAAHAEPEGDGVRPALGALWLQDEVERLRSFYQAVQGSRAWRLTQILRRLVGRAW
jgi:hypothetical protein